MWNINILNDKENRIKLVAFCIVILYTIILTKILLIYTENTALKLEQKKASTAFVSAKKFNILDRNENLLATSLNAYNFYISPAKTVFAEEAVEKIISLFPEYINEKTLMEQLKNKKNKLVLIKKEITDEQKNAIINLGIESAEFEKSYSRIYPYNNVFSHIVGYVNSNFEGVLGLERSLNNELYYNNVKTTLDSRIQIILHSELQEAFEKYKMEGAFGIISEIKNGEILSLVSLPDFEPKNINNPSAKNMKNNVVSSVFQLGSVFKILTIAMALENGVKEEDLFKVDSGIIVDKNFILKDEFIKKPYLKPVEILAFSSNVGSVLMLEKVGFAKQRKFFEEIGVFSPPKIELSPYEITAPIFKNGVWAKSMHYTAAYGYGIALSPLHFVQIARTLVNDGKKGYLTLLKKENEDTEKEASYEEKTIISSETAKKMQQMMQEVTRIGTGKRANINGYEICGKTSTSLKYDAKLKKWTTEKKVVSFFAVFPCSNPKYLIYIGFDEPKKTNEDSILQGGRSVAPVAAKIITEIAPILNIKPHYFE